jgi:hypothetical protein
MTFKSAAKKKSKSSFGAIHRTEAAVETRKLIMIHEADDDPRDVAYKH